MKLSDVSLVSTDNIQKKIYTIRGIQVMLDEDLAVLYKVSTKRLNEQVKRNRYRFPEQFCFKIKGGEYNNLKSQFATSSLRSQIATFKNKVGRKYLPFVFTEQGVAMLSGVLKSKVAIAMSIQIMSEFVAMRKTVQNNSIILSRLENVEQKQIVNKIESDKKFDQIFDALASHDDIPKQKIFFDGEVFDAHKFVSDIVRSAKSEIILIDNFIDDTVLSLFTKRKAGVKVTIFCKNMTPQIANDLRKFNGQYPPVEIKEFTQSHDRFLIIDKTKIYHFGASLKDLGKKWFAVSRFDNQAIEFLRKLK